jgi:hypothetical protein
MLLLLLLLVLILMLLLLLVLMLVLDPSPREAEPFTRTTRRSRRPLLAPCSQLRASDTITPVRGLYRKERTDHGRQPARVPPLLATPAKPFSLVRHPESRRRRGTSPMV